MTGATAPWNLDAHARAVLLDLFGSRLLPALSDDAAFEHAMARKRRPLTAGERALISIYETQRGLAILAALADLPGHTLAQVRHSHEQASELFLFALRAEAQRRADSVHAGAAAAASRAAPKRRSEPRRGAR